LDYIDPEHRYIQHRLYRQHCYLTPEGYYVKDLRVIANRRLSQMVLIDNSVYSFAYQLSNGVPIVPFYREPPLDEEMLHLIYYLSCLANVEDVRTQNKQAFELHKLAGLPEEQTHSSLYIQEEEEELVEDSTDQSLVPT
jgi:CTD small phosphatase-like protein 2